MTGRELILYILANNLEDEPVIKDGKILGFKTIEEVAVEMEVGVPTIYALICQDELDANYVGTSCFISANYKH